MCLIPEPCNDYAPDWDAAERSGNLCWGMGASLPCVHCGRGEVAHDPAWNPPRDPDLPRLIGAAPLRGRP